MSEQKDGGPAFPRTGEGFGNPRYDAQGMTLRDWFAGQALAGMLADPEVGNADSDDSQLAKIAYAYATAMLAERAKAQAVKE